MSEKQQEEGEIELDASNAAERRTLIWVLAINFLQVIVAGVVGVIADSTGLLGAALDNLGDAGVYAVSLYAVGRTIVAKVRVARLSGLLLIAFGLALFVEVLRRFFVGAEPIGLAMIVTALANAALNVVCLKLLRSHRDRGVHLKASWIFTTNDMLANAGIVASGAAVMFFASPLPDLIIGLLVGGIVLKGGWNILKEAHDAIGDGSSRPKGQSSPEND
ncbi:MULTISPECIES: cation transporter [Alphaproteobacteria]|jgi:Co/Zn/Cd efflux system component|uniref:Cation efflux protein transmembrane domain-containing protein n=3 Tax=Hyphomicrobiales TaxID=356 RepID=A0A5S9PGX6_9HYPH|nr:MULTISPECIES: cation transporter [Alphaproteobacteria]MCA0276217.1 cation transporter [Pseudomonadota bacterium]ODT73859.1 MAG: cation transporter [Pelagibacterium sp. SCN 64-44]QOD64884.1 cation transporter [Ochrobactrum sp. MT180101]RTL91032.1 cation transporter [Ancylobacter aquaticus]MAU23703.1 cation transporter [Martelella sp.]|tara:strand:+ start:937 stop:1593 length:657 start_codon:yes stop_codon:yes gene_type:complete